MSSTTLQQLKELGESLGLQGNALVDFIKEQQNTEREEREKLRQEKEKEREEAAKQRAFLQADMRRCHICGEAGHIKNQCPGRSPDPKSPSPPRPQRMPPPRTPPSQRQQWQTQQQKPALRCFLCNKPGHIARNCTIKPAAAAVEFPTRERGPDESQKEATVPKTLDSGSPARNSVPPRTCRKHNWVDCGACLNPIDPTHH